MADRCSPLPKRQGRLLAVVRVFVKATDFCSKTEDATREKLFNSLFRFTYAGDFFVEDLSEQFRYFGRFVKASHEHDPSLTAGLLTRESVPPTLEGGMMFTSRSTSDLFVPLDSADSYRDGLLSDGCVSIPPELYETRRIENGFRLRRGYGQNTIVPESA